MFAFPGCVCPTVASKHRRGSLACSECSDVPTEASIHFTVKFGYTAYTIHLFCMYCIHTFCLFHLTCYWRNYLSMSYWHRQKLIFVILNLIINSEQIKLLFTTFPLSRFYSIHILPIHTGTLIDLSRSCSHKKRIY